MANNYLQFSEELVGLSEDDAKWATDYLAFFSKVQSDCDEQGIEIEEHPMADEFMRRRDLYDLDEDAEGLDFQYEFQYEFEDEEGEGLKALWFIGDEYGNVDHVCLFVQEFLRARRPDGCFHISWAVTCSRPRIGEFGGGAAFVTAEKIEWMNSYDWIDKKCKEFLDGKDAS